jgi:photosystem II stability/assembly factor-like uncharacterized protein
MVLGMLLPGGCAPASPTWAHPASAGLLSSGHWEITRQIDYYALPETDLRGEIRPNYVPYMVTLAGFHTGDFGLTAGPDDDVRYTTDGGQTWTKAPSALHCRHGLEIVDENVAWHCGNGGTRLSTDGGQTWKTVSPSACPYLSFLDAQTGWAASPYEIQATHDSGVSWEKIAKPAAMQDIAAITLRTVNDGAVLDAAGSLFVTQDGGRNWDIRSLGLRTGERLLVSTSGPLAVIRFLDARQGMLIFDLPDRTVWSAVTLDGGQTWQRREILELRDQSYYYHLFLSQDVSLLTVTDDFNNGKNVSLVLKYRQP